MKLIAIILSLFCSLQAACKGKLDVAPTVMRLDVLEFGRTVDKLDLGGFRIAGDYFLWRNVLARGTILVGRGDAELEAYTAGLGVCLPYKKFYFTPYAGMTYTNFRSCIDIKQFGLFDLKQHFTGYGPYIALDAQYCFTPTFRMGAGIFYGWSRTKTVVKPFPSAKSSSKGPNYTFMIEKDLSKQWSINIGAGLNRSLDREKHGLKGKGLKIGVTRWF